MICCYKIKHSTKQKVQIVPLGRSGISWQQFVSCGKQKSIGWQK